jgi:hypothetical protein
MKYFLLLLLFSSCTVSNSKKFNPRYDQVTNDKCCAQRRPNGICTHELVPGCSNPASPLFKKAYMKPDSCCAYWGVDGMCHKELVKGCSADLLYKY